MKPYAGIKATGMRRQSVDPADGRQGPRKVARPQHLKRRGRKGRRM